MPSTSCPLDVYAYAMSLDGPNEEAGGADVGEYYALLLAPFAPTTEEIEEFELPADDVALLGQQVGAILTEDDQGFVDVTWFEDADQLREEWAEIEAGIRAREEELAADQGDDY